MCVCVCVCVYVYMFALPRLTIGKHDVFVCLPDRDVSQVSPLFRYTHIYIYIERERERDIHRYIL